MEVSRRCCLHRLLAAGMAGTLWRPAAASPAPPPDSVLRRRVGLVLINGRPAEPGAPVASGDTVATGPDGEAVFILGDDAFLLRAASQVTIVDHDRARELTLDGGSLLSVFGPKQISLRTPLLTVGIRGTAAYLESGPERVHVCVCYGHAVMTPTGAPELTEEVRNHHHETPRTVRRQAGGVVMAPEALPNHTDEELVMLEALLGRVPPFRR